MFKGGQRSDDVSGACFVMDGWMMNEVDERVAGEMDTSM